MYMTDRLTVSISTPALSTAIMGEGATANPQAPKHRNFNTTRAQSPEAQHTEYYY